MSPRPRAHVGVGRRDFFTSAPVLSQRTALHPRCNPPRFPLPSPLSLSSLRTSSSFSLLPSLPPSIHRGDFFQHPSVSLESRGTGEREDKKSTWKGNASARGRGACVGRGAEGDSNSTKREWMTIRMGTAEGKAFQVN